MWFLALEMMVRTKRGGERFGGVSCTLEETLDERQLVGVVVDRKTVGKTEQFRFASEYARR